MICPCEIKYETVESAWLGIAVVVVGFLLLLFCMFSDPDKEPNGPNSKH